MSGDTLWRIVNRKFLGSRLLGRIVLRPAVEAAFLYGRLTRGVNLADASPERSVVGSRVPIFLIHGLADDNIPFQQSERIRAHNPGNIVLWEVPNAGHCGAVNAAGQEFDTRVLGWFTSHDDGQAAPAPRS
jgi:pimeloyl-ACP methyl ester carboxylesterase